MGYVVIHLLWVAARVPQGDDVHRLPDVVYPVNQFVVLVHHQAAVKGRQVGKVWLLPADVRKGGKKLVVGKKCLPLLSLPLAHRIGHTLG